MMGARAVLGRLREFGPRTATELRRFVSKEANEVQLREPVEMVSSKSAAELLSDLSAAHLEHVNLTCPRGSRPPFDAARPSLARDEGELRIEAAPASFLVSRQRTLEALEA